MVNLYESYIFTFFCPVFIYAKQDMIISIYVIGRWIPWHPQARDVFPLIGLGRESKISLVVSILSAEVPMVVTVLSGIICSFFSTKKQ